MSLIDSLQMLNESRDNSHFNQEGALIVHTEVLLYKVITVVKW